MIMLIEGYIIKKGIRLFGVFLIFYRTKRTNNLNDVINEVNKFWSAPYTTDNFPHLFSEPGNPITMEQPNGDKRMRIYKLS